MSVNVDLYIGKLVDYAIEKELCTEYDRTYMVNSLLMILKKYDYTPVESPESFTLEEILKALCDYAVEKGLIETDSVVLRDIFDTTLMGALTPTPSQVIGKFFGLLKESPEKATDYFYKLSRDSDYIRTYRVTKDLKWIYKGKYGDLDITVNLSKPEKDPKMIAAAKSMPQTGYPVCALCRQNEGFVGDISHAARRTIRLIPMKMGGEQWFLQYSPYSYYNEHCIALADQHRPMKINRGTFEKMLDFIETLPHYFIGSNADLPIVGGSILTHDHMQGGRYEFAMTRAKIEKNLTFKGFEDVKAGLLDWPMTAIRLDSNDKSRLVALADKILNVWRGYSDVSVGVIAESDGQPHNTVTPIARMSKDGQFELDLVLRCNITSEEHKLGVFHPHAEKHHIKKENIGLIEVMGLAVLPSRLKEEIALLKDALLSGADIAANEKIAKHAEWAEKLKKQYDFSPENCEDILKLEIGRVFEAVLEDAGVYKLTPDGRKAFDKFVTAVNNK